MLVYNPAFDPYHSAFRIMRILEKSEGKILKIEFVRILDFYLTFPALASKIRLRIMDRRWKKHFLQFDNPYHFTGTPKMVLQQMEPFQRTALCGLVARGIINKDEFIKGNIAWGKVTLPKELKELIKEANEREHDVIDFLVGTLLEFDLYGCDGIKARTGLLEFKYDAEV